MQFPPMMRNISYCCRQLSIIGAIKLVAVHDTLWQAISFDGRRRLVKVDLYSGRFFSMQVLHQYLHEQVGSAVW